MKINIFVVIEAHNSHIKIIHETTTSCYLEMNGKTEKEKNRIFTELVVEIMLNFDIVCHW